MFENLTPEGMLKMPVGAIAATGSNQANAAQLVSGINVVSAADATKGVLLPVIDSDRIGSICIVVNSAAAVLKVYPEVGGTIDGGAANANVAQIASSNGYYIATGVATWVMNNVARL